jgi:O-6-methylguanine DNA methyltransferase
MADKIYLEWISKPSFLKENPTLFYGTNGEWFAVMTPNGKICALTSRAFPHYQRLLRSFQKHTLLEKTMTLDEKIPCLLAGSPFQHQVWKALLQIPRGNTISYLALAQNIHRPKSVRAVANAVGANPISPLIPCHRVVGSHGYFGGYFWGTLAKQRLLEEEGVDLSSFKGLSF